MIARWGRWCLGGVVLLMLATAGAWANRLDPLPPEEAFNFGAEREGERLVVRYVMPEGIYLYRDRLHLRTDSDGVSLHSVRIPKGEAHEDPFFGRTTVLYGVVNIEAGVRGEGAVRLIVSSQGCDEQVGICYPPMENEVVLAAWDGGGGGTADGGAEVVDDEAGELSESLKSQSLWLNFLLFFALGVGLSLTPCVLPMIPILLGILGKRATSRRRVLALTMAYVGGVTLVFTVIGLLAAASGQLLVASLQTPAVIAAVSLLFVLLALSMFGLYDLHPPAFLRHLGERGGGGAFGAFAMGAVSVAVVSPCVAPPLIGVLLYIAGTGDYFVGAATLFSLSLGMSVLLVAVGVAGSAILPRPGVWMNTVKNFFGALLLFVAVWVASAFVPVPLQMVLYGLLLMFTGFVLMPAGGASMGGSGTALMKTLALASVLWGSALLLGVAMGGRDVLYPLSGVVGQGGGNRMEQEGELIFERVRTVEGLEARVAGAGRPVMLDFYADWCISCKEFERFTLTDGRVKAALRDVVLLRADVTRNDDEDKRLLSRFGLFGPPAVLFYAADGRFIERVRVSGYEDAEEFLETLRAAGIVDS